MAQITGRQVRRNIRLDERDRFPIARASAAEPSETALLGNRDVVVDAHDGHVRLLSVPVGFAEEGMDEQHQCP